MIKLLGSASLVYVARLATCARLRVLAYHNVVDAVAFQRHLDIIQEYYTPVSGAQVAAAISKGTQLPRRAIWITFDDAYPRIFIHALQQLADRNIFATLFVCPGLVDTQQPYWWQVIEISLAHGMRVELGGKLWSDPSVITHLKQVPDHIRRATVDRATNDLADAGHSVAVPQVTSAALRDWLDAGHEIGNHTWDHPCLDTCDADQQREQIVAADEWLRDLLSEPPRLFAYPNGNTAEPSRRLLAGLGYNVAALFDHRLARLDGPEVSRLRVDADAPERRLAAIVSGAHPAAYAVARRIRDGRGATGGSR